MKIAHYYARLFGPPAGVTAAISAWARAQADAGHDVLLLGSGDPAASQQKYPADISVEGVHHRGWGRMTNVPVSLGSHMQGSDVLILHEGWVPSMYVAAVKATRMGLPYVVVPHGVHNARWAAMMRGERVRRILERQMLRHAAGVHLFFDGEIPEQRAISADAHCFVAPTGYEPSASRWRGDRPELVWIGRYSVAHKGLDLLAEAMARLPRSERPCVILRGTDYLGGRAAIETIVNDLGLAEDLIVGPPVDGEEKVQLLLSCSGYVLPSRWESHAIALLEALGHAVPTLASASMPISDGLRRSDAARVCSTSSVELAEALRLFGRLSHQQRQDLGERGRKFITEQFNWPKIMTQYDRDVAAAIAGRASSGRSR